MARFGSEPPVEIAGLTARELTSGSSAAAEVPQPSRPPSRTAVKKHPDLCAVIYLRDDAAAKKKRDRQVCTVLVKRFGDTSEAR